MITLIYNSESTPLNTFTLDVLKLIKDEITLPFRDNSVDRNLLFEVLQYIASHTNFGDSKIENEILLFFTQHALELIKINHNVNFVLKGSNHHIYLAFGQHIKGKHINHKKIRIYFNDEIISFDKDGTLTGKDDLLIFFMEELYQAKMKSFYSEIGIENPQQELMF